MHLNFSICHGSKRCNVFPLLIRLQSRRAGDAAWSIIKITAREVDFLVSAKFRRVQAAIYGFRGFRGYLLAKFVRDGICRLVWPSDTPTMPSASFSVRSAGPDMDYQPRTCGPRSGGRSQAAFRHRLGSWSDQYRPDKDAAPFRCRRIASALHHKWS